MEKDNKNRYMNPVTSINSAATVSNKNKRWAEKDYTSLDNRDYRNRAYKEALEDEITKLEKRLRELDQKIKEAEQRINDRALGTSQIRRMSVDSIPQSRYTSTASKNEIDKRKAIEMYSHNTPKKIPATQDKQILELIEMVNNKNKDNAVLLLPKKEEKKLSFWQKFKKAVKDFFTDLPKEEKKENLPQNNKNERREEFKKSVGKTNITMTTNISKREPPKDIGRNFDRYA